MHASSIPEVIANLQQIIADEAAQHSRLALFPALYCELTQRFAKGLSSGEFREPARLEQIGIRFANRYFDALTAYRRGDKPTKSWLVSFEQAKSARLFALQDILLGINAHINLDLSIATAEIGDRIHELEDLFDRSHALAGHRRSVPGVLRAFGDNAPGERPSEAARGLLRWPASVHGPARTAWIEMLDVSASRLGYMIASPSYLVRKAIELIRETEERDVGVIVAALAKVQP